MWDVISQIISNNKQNSKGVGADNPLETAEDFINFLQMSEKGLSGDMEYPGWSF